MDVQKYWIDANEIPVGDENKFKQLVKTEPLLSTGYYNRFCL